MTPRPTQTSPYQHVPSTTPSPLGTFSFRDGIWFLVPAPATRPKPSRP